MAALGYIAAGFALCLALVLDVDFEGRSAVWTSPPTSSPAGLPGVVASRWVGTIQLCRSVSICGFPHRL